MFATNDVEPEELSLERRVIFWVTFVLAEVFFGYIVFVGSMAHFGEKSRLLMAGVIACPLAIPLVVGSWKTASYGNVWTATNLRLEKAASVVLGLQFFFCTFGSYELVWIVVTGKGHW
jgi:hypothetical protein